MRIVRIPRIRARAGDDGFHKEDTEGTEEEKTEAEETFGA
jgi:hypothetical protein